MANSKAESIATLRQRPAQNDESAEAANTQAPQYGTAGKKQYHRKKKNEDAKTRKQGVDTKSKIEGTTEGRRNKQAENASKRDGDRVSRWERYTKGREKTLMKSEEAKQQLDTREEEWREPVSRWSSDSDTA